MDAISTHIYFLLDRTGSMEAIKDDVIGGFNQFLADQRAKPGECRLTLVQFDDQDPFEIIHEARNIALVPVLGGNTYTPRGLTPLLDAEGRLIALAEEHAAARRAHDEPPEAVIVVTYTDGHENSSKEWTLDALRAKKAEHESEWAFLYLGVGHDAYNQASGIGTHAANTYSGARTTDGNFGAYAAAATEVDHVRDRASKGLRTNSSQTRAAETNTRP
jgi:hypothetical protein